MEVTSSIRLGSHWLIFLQHCQTRFRCNRTEKLNKGGRRIFAIWSANTNTVKCLSCTCYRPDPWPEQHGLTHRTTKLGWLSPLQKWHMFTFGRITRRPSVWRNGVIWLRNMAMKPSPVFMSSVGHLRHELVGMSLWLFSFIVVGILLKIFTRC